MSKMRRKPVHVGAAWRIALSDLGQDEHAVLRRAGLPLSLLDGSGTRISMDEYVALHRALETESNDPELALRVGQMWSTELFDPALFAALCSADLNTAVRRMADFKRLVGPFGFDVDQGARETVIRYRCKHRPSMPWTHSLAELVFMVAFARRGTRRQVVPVRVTVQELPLMLEPYTSFFGCPVVTGKATTLTFSATDACRPFLTRHTAMWDAFEPSLRRRMDQAKEHRTAHDRVESALFELLPSGRSRMADVAKELGIGVRTLQRRLADEDTTWLEILNETRERLACHYLKNSTMSTAEVSFLLGFEDANSLFRAFQRWTGTTPEVWREATQASPDFVADALS